MITARNIRSANHIAIPAVTPKRKTATSQRAPNNETMATPESWNSGVKALMTTSQNGVASHGLRRTALKKQKRKKRAREMFAESKNLPKRNAIVWGIECID